LAPAYLNSEDFAKEVKDETERYTKIAEETGIRK
jgi:tripartite-type tricarboxylate transporter receptor subunit TctC